MESADTSGSNEQPLSLFICYAQADQQVVGQLKPSLVMLARRSFITPWRDTDLVPGEDWDETIKDRLSKAQVILFMVSRHFLASKYITEQERPLAMRLVSQNKARVVPVLLSPCLWREEDFAAFEKLPEKDKPLTSFQLREKAWSLVEDGLVKLVKQWKPAIERRVLIEALQGDMKLLLKELSPVKQDEASQVMENLDVLVKQAMSPKPDRKWYSQSAKELLDASKSVKKFNGNITGTINNLGKSLWPDFDLSMRD